MEQKGILIYKPLIEKVEEDLKKWISLPLNLLGCVNSIKMNVLPKC